MDLFSFICGIVAMAILVWGLGWHKQPRDERGRFKRRSF